ncbi:MFS transporter [Porphyrobacter sp. TH134]|uniref:MFS transporter n=1 Tax=Porphyrobacter sp. TH134 TaxID=2067450 RepID=UPI000C7E0E7A|nr:MFS transporter [Porphyrobacter sp. TH134]PLK22807.1 MFS transporter [Porphyrobacter sp. TH134]
MPTMSAHPVPFDRDTLSFILTAIVLGTVGVLSFIVQPGLVQGFVSEFGFSEAAANKLAFWEMAGVALATLAVAATVTRLPVPTTIAAALILAVLGNLASAVVGRDFLVLSAVRFVTGLGEGVIIALSFSLVGLTVHIQRNLAWYLALLLTYGAMGLWAMPAAFATVGLEGIFIVWAALTALALLLVPFCPAMLDTAEQPGEGAVQLGRPMLGLALCAVLLYNTGIGLAWANLFLIGLDLGGSEQEVANALLVSQFVAIFGAFAAVFLADSLRPRYVVVGGILGGALALLVLVPKPGFLVFALAVSVFNFLWNMTLPFLLAAAGKMDVTGRMIAAAVAMQMLGLGFGPLLAGQLLVEGSGYAAVEVLSAALLGAGAAAIIVPMVQRRRIWEARQVA